MRDPVEGESVLQRVYGKVKGLRKECINNK